MLTLRMSGGSTDQMDLDGAEEDGADLPFSKESSGEDLMGGNSLGDRVRLNMFSSDQVNLPRHDNHKH